MGSRGLGPSGGRSLQAGREVGGIWCGKSGAVHGGSKPPPYDRVREVFGKSGGRDDVGIVPYEGKREAFGVQKKVLLF